MKKINKQGFTLLEMLIVLVVVGLLMALIIPNVAGQKQRIEKQAKQDIAQIVETQINTYKLVEKDDEVTLSELEDGGYLTTKQVSEAKRLLELSEDEAISTPIEVSAD